MIPIEGITIDSNIDVYSRKSRPDEDIDVLQKHRRRLEEFISANGFTNVTWYEEVITGSTIEERHKFLELLEKVRSGKSDLVICVDYDRITRGDALERGTIQRVFMDSRTKIYTLDGNLVDFNNDNSLLQVEVKGLLSNYELKQITKRFKIGKIDTVKKGTPHSGTAPYGYKWDRNTRSVEVDEEQYKGYRLMIEWYIKDGYSIHTIASKLNDLGIKAPKGGRWYGESVSKLLQNEFHLGYVVYGKYKSEKTGRFNSKGQMINRIIENPDLSSVTKVIGKHKPIKTPEEHAKIVKRSIENRKYGHANKVSGGYDFKLKSLVRCPYCGLMTGIVSRADRKNQIRKCMKPSKHRKKECDTTAGIVEDILYMNVIQLLREYKDELFSEEVNEGNEAKNTIEIEIEALEKGIQKVIKDISKEKEMFKADVIDIHTLKKNVDELEATQQSLETELIKLKQSKLYLVDVELEERKEKWFSNDVIRLLENPNDPEFTNKDINEILKSIILYINYTRDGDALDINITYK